MQVEFFPYVGLLVGFKAFSRHIHGNVTTDRRKRTVANHRRDNCLYGYLGEAGTIDESPTFYTRHAFREDYRSQATAVPESHHSYTRHAFGEGNGGQTTARIESSLSYTGHAFRDCDGSQATTFEVFTTSY